MILPVRFMDVETLDACVSMYTKRNKTIGEGDAAVLYDYCQVHGIRKLAAVEHLDWESPPDVHPWIVKHAWDQFHYLQTWLVPRLIGQIRFVTDTDSAVQNWLVSPYRNQALTVCHNIADRLEEVPRQMLWHRQCLYLLGAVHQPLINNIITDSCSRSARRLVYDQPQRTIVAQRHRLLYKLAGHLPEVDSKILVPGIFSA